MTFIRKLLFISLIYFAYCKHNLILEQLKRRHLEMYGNWSKNYQVWSPELEEQLAYPRGDKQKLAEISNHWLNYYECLMRLASRVTASGHLTSTIIMTYEGTAVRLPCDLCVSPGDIAAVWEYAQDTTGLLRNLNFSSVEDKETYVTEANRISVFNVGGDDAGVYRCRIGDSVSGLVVLEVGIEEYNVVKPRSSRGQYSQPSTTFKGLKVFSLWSPWSECSHCGRVGRRRRFGPCYVKDIGGKHELFFNDTVIHTKTIFEAFPKGIPCRSRYLPELIKTLPQVTERANEIMIGLCKVSCQHESNVVRAQPPPPARDVTFLVRGEPAVLKCLGTSLRDMPVTWRVGTKPVDPRSLRHDSADRVHLTATDNIVFTYIMDVDQGLYSCRQRESAVGAVRVAVVGRGRGGAASGDTPTYTIAYISFILLLLPIIIY